MRLILICLVLAASPLLADEVKLKNGKVRKNLKLIEETKTTYRFMTVDGRKLTIKKKAVAEYVKKPSSLDVLEERLAALGPTDAPQLFELAQWAKDEGMKKEVKRLLERVVEADPNHAGAREALGQKQFEGEWLSERDWERTLKKRGYRKVKGSWYSPGDARRIKKGLVPHEGHWVTKKLLAKIQKKGWVYHEGEWRSPEDRQKMLDGLRPDGKKWASISTLDGKKTSLDNPWVLKARHTVVWSNLDHARATVVREWAEDFYQSCVAVFGRDVDVDDDTGRIRVIAVKTLNEYKKIGSAHTATDRAGIMSAGLGSFYTPRYADKRPAVCTYWHTRDYLHYWTGVGVSQAVLTRLVGDDEGPKSPLRNVLGAYLSCFHEGKYEPTWFQYADQESLRSPDLRRLEVGAIVDKVELKDKKKMMRAGFAVHFLASRRPAAFAEFLRARVLNGSGRPADLFAACAGDAAPKTLADEFFNFTRAYQASFRPWDKK